MKSYNAVHTQVSDVVHSRGARAGPPMTDLLLFRRRGRETGDGGIDLGQV